MAVAYVGKNQGSEMEGSLLAAFASQLSSKLAE